MMDDERYKRDYNSVREECLCRGGDNCGIPTPDTEIYPLKTPRPVAIYPPKTPTHIMIQRKCEPDKYLECPLFVFIKRTSCTMHNRW